MKRWWTLVIAAAAVLGAAAVWMGGINQDEGWYLYAANLVHAGLAPYRDFFFTQGPMLPLVYSAFTGVWAHWGLLGARIFNLLVGFAGIAVAVSIARRLASAERRSTAGLVTFLLLGANLYHLYYLAIPKTYALAALFLLIGFRLLLWNGPRFRGTVLFGAGLSLAFAAGTRISLGVALAVVAVWFLWRREWLKCVHFALGGLTGLMLVYGPYVFDQHAFSGLLAAQRYHAARGGFDVVWTVGSVSRLVRWYLPIVVVALLGDFRQARLCLVTALAVIAFQLTAPFPYDDYQVPVMALLAIYVAVNFNRRQLLPVVALAFAVAFGSPLLEKWTTNGQDRFWTLKKEATELSQLRKVARMIDELDPGGRELLTQDLYLAIETNRRVPAGLEMGPFSQLDDAEWRQLLTEVECPVAALSGYSFAIEPPVCNERPIEDQLAYWKLLKERYQFVTRETAFGQQATTLMILKRKAQ